ncbi:hypothetical protein H1R20_g2907, partial [Candolleomyces eurysporus]
MPLLKSNKHHNNNREAPIIDGTQAYPRDRNAWEGQDYPPHSIPPGHGGYDQGYGGNNHHADEYNVNRRALAGDGTAQAIPPASVISHGGAGPGGPGHNGPIRGGGVPMGAGKTTGKVEAAIGTALGSRSLKEKGLQKQYEAEAYRLQGAELAEAERLEKEARLRRDRAVAHGAHPENLQPTHAVGGQSAYGGGVAANQDNRPTW